MQGRQRKDASKGSCQRAGATNRKIKTILKFKILEQQPSTSGHKPQRRDFKVDALEKY